MTEVPDVDLFMTVLASLFRFIFCTLCLFARRPEMDVYIDAYTPMKNIFLNTTEAVKTNVTKRGRWNVF